MVLGRTGKQRWHLFRTMTTQLVEYERIWTTQAKAKHLRSYAERVMKYAKSSAKGNNNGTILMNRVLTTKKAREKATLQLAPRYQNQRDNYVRVSKVAYRRRGDNAPMVKIQYRGNQMELYQKQLKEEELKKNPNTLDKKNWKIRVFEQQKQYLLKKMTEPEQITPKQFFQKKIADIDFEISLERRKKGDYPQFRQFL